MSNNFEFPKLSISTELVGANSGNLNIEEHYDEEKAQSIFKFFKNKNEPELYSAEWYRWKYPNFPEEYYETFEKFSNDSVKTSEILGLD